ncbi:MAG: helix-turn-helix transcriptional regulator [Bacteroidales bacterium]|jgi:transcriptional regulator with XRE-family HTH domain
MEKVIGSNIKFLREMNNFTQDAVAKYLGIERSTYSNYELGLREIPFDLDILEKLSDLFGCEMCMFYEEDKSVLEQVLTCAFRVEGISESDMKQIAYFKSIVKSYLKMDKLLKS